MCAVNIAENTQPQPYTGEPIVNDCAFTVATKNGSGSQTSNNVLVMSLFKMGIPVNGKNLFPSNIKGLPTWYTIRASKYGYTARRATTEICVAMNQDTAADDIANLPEGGVCILPTEWKWTHSRDDIIYYEIPVDQIIKSAEIDRNFRDRVSNMVYVGAVAQLFSIPLDTVYQALLDNFGGKEKAAKMNFGVVQAAADWTKENLVKQDPYQFAPMNENQGKIVITGNEAGALGSIFGGVTMAAWYPITPSTSLIDAVLSFKDLRTDPDTGKDTVAVVQAEDEIAAIGMIIGAGWAGARAMTATGLPTRTSQGDLIFTYFLGHGDSRQLILLPGSVEECFEFGWRAFDISEQFQTPVFVLSDLDLGMNNWMAQPFEYPSEPLNRGKVLNAEELEAVIQERGRWGRYVDSDGDNEFAVYSERGSDWVKNMERLRRKLETARATLPAPVIEQDTNKKVGIISFGSNHDAIREARDYLAEDGIETNYLRVRALPLASSVFDFIRQHERVYVVENNYDGQLHQLIAMEFHEDMKHVVSLALGDSLPMTPRFVREGILKRERGEG
jgi:2-oxoglutarate/2-oxoacid ferredoxin oxidoreductase subunit alpha